MAATQMAKFKSREYLDLVKSIGECKSKIEEDAIMKNEVVYLKKRLSDPKLDKGKLREYLLRLLYVELLGHDASFGHIHAVKLCSDPSLVNKKVAYLTTCLFLSENSELLILLMNTMKSDLHSDNYLVVCTALETVCKLSTEDALPLILPSIKELLSHGKDIVRKKAVMALHRFYLKAPHMMDNYGALCRKALCDHDPSVMGAALIALHEAIKRDPAPFKNLVKSLLHVLSQIVDRRLPKTYDNHRAPAPFMQIKILKMLALLGQGDKAASLQMHPVILSCLKSANSGTGIGNALVYECVRTSIAIHPDERLLTASAAVVAHFLNSSHAGVAATAANNLKYVGLDALGGIVQIDASYGEKHQLAVIDCLEDPDETLKKKTLELLYRMTTTDNVEIVVDKMLTFLEQTSDEHIRADVATRVSELAEQYAPDNHWFIDTMNRVFELAGDLLKPELADDLMQLIADGTGESEEVDTELRKSAVESYIELLSEQQAGGKSTKMPRLLLMIVAWVLGEYGTLVLSPAELMELLSVGMASRVDCSSDDAVKAFIVTAISKVVCRSGGAADGGAFISPLLNSRSLDLQQRAMETANLAAHAETHVWGPSSEEIEFDTLFTQGLDAYVQQALANGAAPYLDSSLRDTEELAKDVKDDPGLLYQHTEDPAPSSAAMGGMSDLGLGGPSPGVMLGGIEPLSSILSGEDSAALAQQAQAKPAPGPQLNVTSRKWGRPAPQPAAPPPSAVPAQPEQHQAAASFSHQHQEASYVPEPQLVHEEEHEPTEREALAASLFGSNRGSGRGRRRGRGNQQPQQQQQQALGGRPQQQQNPDLLDLMGGGTSQPAQPPVPQQQQPVPDLLDLGSGGGSSGGASGADALADLMGGGSVNPTSAPPNMMGGGMGGGGMGMMGMGMGMGMGGGGMAQQQAQQKAPMKGPGTPTKPKDPFQDLLM